MKSTYFSMEELIRSDTAVRHQIKNKPSFDEWENIQRLVRDVLDPLREYMGTPVRITSGYRCHELNRIVGGSTTSYHMAGLAADLIAADGSLSVHKICDVIASSSWPFDLVIDEFGQWVHVQVAAEGIKPRGLALKAWKSNGRTVYAPRE